MPCRRTTLLQLHVLLRTAVLAGAIQIKVWADAPKKAPSAVPAAPVETASESALPLQIPGYQLRVLDQSKPILFNVGGSWVKASVPIFVYFPTAAQDRRLASDNMRQVYADLVHLSGQPEWTADELQAVLSKFKTALGLLEDK